MSLRGYRWHWSSGALSYPCGIFPFVLQAPIPGFLSITVSSQTKSLVISFCFECCPSSRSFCRNLHVPRTVATIQPAQELGWWFRQLPFYFYPHAARQLPGRPSSRQAPKPWLPPKRQPGSASPHLFLFSSPSAWHHYALSELCTSCPKMISKQLGASVPDFAPALFLTAPDSCRST